MDTSIEKVFVIAEAGINHNGSIKLAKKLVDIAVEAEVDAVKFQTWRTELLVTKQADMAEYQKVNTGIDESQYNMLKRYELTYEEFIDLKKYCDKKHIMFVSTPDEEESASFLDSLQSIFKIGSGELTNTPFLRHIASFGKPIILSTGMGRLSEIEHAINTLTSSGVDRPMITVLHATTQYPAPMEETNLKAMLNIAEAFPGVRVGYSDHTLGIEVPVAAVALGAKVIEKHYTIDKEMEGPDHRASLNASELRAMVKAIRNIEKALGNGIKEPTPSEMANLEIVRKSIYASRKIVAGEKFSSENMETKRPGNGTSPEYWDDIIGTKAKKDYNPGDRI